MDCSQPVDDYCVASQDDDIKIPKIPSTDDNLDQFFIVFEVEIISPILDDDDDDGDDGDEVVVGNRFVDVEETDFFTFWAPCPRIEHKNLTKERISGMLSSVGVPLHKQEFMVERISDRADEMANAAYNNGKKVLPMIVSISIITCLCCGESVED